MQFIDVAEVQAQGGKGGDGIVAFRREKYVPAGGPAGGNGGDGGAVILEATHDLQTLLDFQYNRLFKAGDGGRGGPKNMTGAKGEDRLIKVPCGTLVMDADREIVLGDLTNDGDRLVVAKGGKGGLGNKFFLSNSKRAPDFALPGLEGEFLQLRLELKLIAQVGIIGLPNAGKSTLISVLSAARPKIADYPFTTLVPNLGVVSKPDGDGVVFADIPGLIEGASMGIGLGHDFLRHIERTQVLIHLVDATADDPLHNYQTIQAELSAYGQGLPQKPQILALNKIDALDQEQLHAVLTSFPKLPLPIAAVTGEGLESLKRSVWELLEQSISLNLSITDDL